MSWFKMYAFRAPPEAGILWKLASVLDFGDQKSLSIAKNHPKPSQEFSEQFGPSIHKMKGFSLTVQKLDV